MANFHLQLTPSLVNRGSKGSMDSTVTNGISLQRTGYFDVYNSGERKTVQVSEGVTFNDTIATWSSHANVVTE